MAYCVCSKPYWPTTEIWSTAWDKTWKMFYQLQHLLPSICTLGHYLVDYLTWIYQGCVKLSNIFLKILFLFLVVFFFHYPSPSPNPLNSPHEGGGGNYNSIIYIPALYKAFDSCNHSGVIVTQNRRFFLLNPKLETKTRT